jgi:hypothetical protein
MCKVESSEIANRKVFDIIYLETEARWSLYLL